MSNLRRSFTRLVSLVLAFWVLAAGALAAPQTIYVDSSAYPVVENGAYTSLEEVAVYLNTYQQLPQNYIDKPQALALGWNSKKGNLWRVAPGLSIGGDTFGNYEGLLPKANGRRWTECDIAFTGGYRNGLRLLFSNDGLFYYSDDHYTSYRQVIVWQSKPTATEEKDRGALNTVKP
jgi:hypothetical protein